MIATAANLITINGLRHSFGAVPALELDHWSLARRHQAAVTGPSGSGKTTLIHILSGLLVPAAGEVSVGDRNWSRMAPAARDRARGRTAGIVFQSFHFIRAVSILDNLRIARRLAGRPRDDTRCRMLLDALGIGALAHRRPAALSRGEGQRAAVARAVVAEPAVILADEPTSALDAGNAAAVMQFLRDQAAASGAGLVVTTHDPHTAALFDIRLQLERPS